MDRSRLISFLKKTVLNPEALRFVIVGVVATILHYGIYYILFKTGLEYNYAYSIGYGGSLIFNYIASVLFSFKTTFSIAKTIKFLLCHLINYLLHIGFLNLFIWIGLPEVVAPALVYCFVVPINFFLVRRALKNTFLYEDSSTDSML